MIGANERFGAGTNQPVNCERPAVGVSQRQLGGDEAQVSARRQVAHEIAGENGLAEIAAPDACDRSSHCVAIALRRQRALAQRDAELRADRCSRGQRSVGVDTGDPADAIAAPEDDVRNDQHTRGTGGVGEGKSSECDEAGTGEGQRIGDFGGRSDALPRLRGIHHSIRTGEFETQRLANSGNTLAAASENQRIPRINQRNQWSDAVKNLRLDSQNRHFAPGVIHSVTVLRRSTTFLTTLDPREQGESR